MRNPWQMLATFVLVAALAASGHAGSGSSNDGARNGKQKQEVKAGKNKPGKEKKAKKSKGKKSKKGKKGKKGKKKSDDNATLAAVQISDDRILDLTGSYILEGAATDCNTSLGTATLALSLVQDNRGDLVGTSLVTLPDGTTAELPVNGELDLDDCRLTFDLYGSSAAWRDDDDCDDDGDDDYAHHYYSDDDDDDDDDDDHWDDDDDDCDDDCDDDDDRTTSVRVRGIWDGTTFHTQIKLTTLSGSYHFESTIVPVNPLRGFIIEPATSVVEDDCESQSLHNVILPWGTITATSEESIDCGKYKFEAKGPSFKTEIEGKVDSAGVVTVCETEVRVGYGSLEPPDGVVVITPSTTTP